MLRENQRLFSGALFITDLVVIAGITQGIARYLGYGSDGSVLHNYLTVFALLAWPLLAWRLQVYHSRRLKSLFQESLLLGKVLAPTYSVALLGTVFLAGVLQTPQVQTSLGTLAVASILAAAVTLQLIRLPFRFLLQRLRLEGYNRRYLVLVGQGDDSEHVTRYIEENRHFGMRILGYFTFVEDNPFRNQDTRRLGSVLELADYLENNVVDEVIITPSPQITLGQINQTIQTVQDFGVSTRLLPQTISNPESQVAMDWFGDLPTLAWFTGPSCTFSVVLKRVVDMLVSSLAILLLSPLLLVTALLVKLTSKGPVFFRQTRCGLQGRTFKAFKFRTMVADAEKLRAALLTQNEEDGPAFKIKKDPRITWIGRWLRKFSIDELPQLFNVVMGDMSLVGPRPPIPSEVREYDRWQRRRLSMRPGITCIWQVKGRNQVTFDEWMRMDMEYIDNWSLALDFKLMALTIPAVLRGTGS